MYDPHKTINYKLCVVDTNKEAHFNVDDVTFELDPVILTSPTSPVNHDTYVRLKHCRTDMWIQVQIIWQNFLFLPPLYLYFNLIQTSQTLYYSDKAEKGWVKMVACRHRLDEETFAINPVHPNEVR